MKRGFKLAQLIILSIARHLSKRLRRNLSDSKGFLKFMLVYLFVYRKDILGYIIMAMIFIPVLLILLLFGPILGGESSYYLVKLDDVPRFSQGSVGIGSIDGLIRDHESQIEDFFPNHNDDSDLGRWVIIKDGDEDLRDILERTVGISDVLENDTLNFIDPGEFEDPDDKKIWNLALIKAEQAHKMLGSNASTVVVAVVDTGVDLGHPALKERLLPGRNIVNGNNNPRNQTPNEMHGTHVSGSIIMDPEYSNGSFGAAYPVARVMPVRVLDQSGRGSYGNIAKGIVWASDNGAQVINMSLGGPFRNKLLHDSVKYAVNSRGIVVVAAKGNSNSSRRFYPAAYPEVMAVTATDKNDNRASFSNYGNDSSASAPGHEIYSSVPGGGFRIASGTSMASPHVSASVALIISKNRDINPQQVRAIIENNGDEIKTDKPVGRRINLVNFLGATNTIPN